MVIIINKAINALRHFSLTKTGSRHTINQRLRNNPSADSMDKGRRMLKRFLMANIAALLLLALAACPELERRPYHEGIDLPDRIQNQQIRIDKGISSGDLTRAEAEIVQDNLNWIKQEYSKAQDDGRMSGEEWNKVERYLDENSRMINDKKNNPARRLFSAPYQAPEVTSIQDKINSQQQRIDQGISTGELTLKEAEIVQGNLNWIKGRYGQFRSDGRLTSKEESEIGEYLERNSDMIFNKKHNPVYRIY
jgi:hypothetical protein